MALNLKASLHQVNAGVVVSIAVAVDNGDAEVLRLKSPCHVTQLADLETLAVIVQHHREFERLFDIKPEAEKGSVEKGIVVVSTPPAQAVPVPETFLRVPETIREEKDPKRGMTLLTRSVVHELRARLLDQTEKGGIRTADLLAGVLPDSTDTRWGQLRRVWEKTGQARAKGERAGTRYFASWTWSHVRAWAKRVGTVTPESLGREYWITPEEARSRLEADDAPAWLERHARKDEWAFRPHAEPRAQEEVSAGQAGTEIPVLVQHEAAPAPVPLAEVDAFAGHAFAETFRAFEAPSVVFVVLSEPRFREGKISLRWDSDQALRSRVAFVGEERARQEAFRESARQRAPHYAVALSTRGIRDAGLLVGPAREYPYVTVPSVSAADEGAVIIVAPQKREVLTVSEAGAADQLLHRVEPPSVS